MMETPPSENTIPLKMAPPDKATEILNEMGYPVNPKLLRKWAKEKKFPSCWTGKRLLLTIDAVVKYLNEGDETPHGDDEYD